MTLYDVVYEWSLMRIHQIVSIEQDERCQVQIGIVELLWVHPDNLLKTNISGGMLDHAIPHIYHKAVALIPSGEFGIPEQIITIISLILMLWVMTCTIMMQLIPQIMEHILL